MLYHMGVSEKEAGASGKFGQVAHNRAKNAVYIVKGVGNMKIKIRKARSMARKSARVSFVPSTFDIVAAVDSADEARDFLSGISSPETIAVKLDPKNFGSGLINAKMMSGTYNPEDKTWILPVNDVVLDSILEADYMGWILV